MYAGRLWGAVGNTLYYAAGSDCTNGDGNQCWPPGNYFTLDSPISCLVPTPSGIVIFTTSDIATLQGTCSVYGTGTLFYVTPLFAGIGVLSYDAVDWHTSNIFFFTSDQRFLVISPSAGLADVGSAIADQFANFSPSSVKVVCHSAGFHDSTVLFVSDGAHNWFRCNPNQQPESTACWSPMGTLSAGLSGLQSCETSPGVHQLLGASGTNIIFRDWTSHQDLGTPFTANAILGPMVLAPSGQLARVDFFTSKAKAIGSVTSLSVLPGEISGTFETLGTYSQDPPRLAPSQSVYSERWYLNQSQLPIKCQFLQLGISWPAENYANEMLELGVFGMLETE
jgi:hypothetical protein